MLSFCLHTISQTALFNFASRNLYVCCVCVCSDLQCLLGSGFLKYDFSFYNIADKYGNTIHTFICKVFQLKLDVKSKYFW